MIKNLVFDLGGVLISFFPKEILEKYNITPEYRQEILEKLFQSSIWDEMDRGTFSYAQASQLLGEKYPHLKGDITNILTKYICQSYEELKDRVAFVRACKQVGYPMYILSNYNEEGYIYVKKKYDFFQLFDGEVVSYQVHSVKPEKEIYEALFSKYKLNPEECLFFDDREDNIAMAKSFGMEGVVVKNPTQMMQDGMKIMGKEFFDLRDLQGEPTGVIKERTLVHRDGDIHGTSHVWIARKNRDASSGFDLLLQKRSADKDSHPGCYDTSSAGHIPAGQDYLESGLRELEEELGIVAAPEDFTCISLHDGDSHAQFYGKPFNNHEISKVYVYTKPVDITKLHLQESEVEGVRWMDGEEVLAHLRQRDPKFCMYLDEVELVLSYLQENQA